MTASDPQDEERDEARVVAALQRLPDFAGAELQACLGNGPTAISYRLRHRGRDLVLRIDKPVARRLGLDRSAELVAMRAAADAGLAPQPLAAEPAAGLLLSEFIPGQIPPAEAFSSEAFLRRLGELLARVHRLPAIGWRGSYLQMVSETYFRAAGGARASALATEIRGLLATLPPGPPDCPCHNDVHPGNLLEVDGRLLLLDWEYAGLSNPLFELAALLADNGLPAMAAEALLAGAGSRPTAALRSRLAVWRPLYDRVAELWQLAVAAEDAQDPNDCYSQDRY